VIRWIPKQLRLGGDLEVLECTSRRIVIKEYPHYVGAVFAIGLGITLVIFSVRANVPAKALAILLASLISAVVAAIGVVGLVQSTVSIDSQEPYVRVHRRLLGIPFRKKYRREDIREVFVWGSRVKGTGLRLRFISGTTRNLTMRTDYFDLEDKAELLTKFIAAPHHR